MLRLRIAVAGPEDWYVFSAEMQVPGATPVVVTSRRLRCVPRARPGTNRGKRRRGIQRTSRTFSRFPPSTRKRFSLMVLSCCGNGALDRAGFGRVCDDVVRGPRVGRLRRRHVPVLAGSRHSRANQRNHRAGANRRCGLHAGQVRRDESAVAVVCERTPSGQRNVIDRAGRRVWASVVWHVR